jgi:hypothetical protein
LGYTHYFDIPKKLDQDKFNTLGEQVKKIVKACRAKGIAIGDGAGNVSEPDIDSNEIMFNGVGSEAHETLCIKRTSDNKAWQERTALVFNFCKTARKPYDVAVTASLIAMKELFPKCELSSDGDDEGGWNEGRELYNSLFKK